MRQTRANWRLSANLWRMDLLSPTLPLLHALHIKALQLPALVFSGLGSEPFYLLLLPLIYWFVDRRIGAQLGLLLLFSVLLNDILKIAFHLPRPYWVDPSLKPFYAGAMEKSFGLPSGHAQGAFLIWPFLALRSNNPKKWMPFALALATCIALSRMILGVHWPLDVVVGALIGGLSLWVFERFGNPAERIFRLRSHTLQLVWCAVFVAFFGALGWVCIGRAMSELGPNTMAFLTAYSNLTGRCAALLGLLVGLVFAPRDVPIRRSALPLGVGLLGLALFYFGLRSLSHGLLSVMFARYFLTTFWVSCGALWVFRRLEARKVAVG